MSDYKKDFENAVRMIDWQNNMIKEQSQRIKALEEHVAYLESQVYGGTTK